MEEIQPTIGRIVHYWPRTCEGLAHYPDMPLAAIIACVHSSNSVNLGVFDLDGNVHSQRVVRLYQPGEKRLAHERGYCEWPKPPEKKC